MRVVLLKGDSQYDVLRVFTDQLSSAFEQLDCHVETFDLLDEDNKQLILPALRQNVDFVFSFNLTGFDLPLGHLNIPFISNIVDHPSYFMQIMKKADVENMSISVVDKGVLSFLNDFVSNIKSTYFLPHGAIVSPTTLPMGNPIQRSIPVFMPGTYYGFDEALSTIKYLPSKGTQDILFAIVEQALSEEWTPLSSVAESVLHTYQLYSPELMKSLAYLLGYVDRCIRAYRREIAIERLVQNHIKVAVCGNGWEKSRYAPCLKIYPAQPVLELIKLMRQAQICLDVGVRFTYGSHERSLTAMYNYTPLVVHQNDFYQDSFVEGKHLLQFTYNDPNDLPSKIIDLLNNPELQATLGQEGHNLVASQHTWLNRAQSILTQFNESIK